jgi:hypothetical protein
MEPRRRNPLRRYPAAVCISLLHFGLTQSKTRALNSRAGTPSCVNCDSDFCAVVDCSLRSRGVIDGNHRRRRRAARPRSTRAL